ncbi:hypothetical protein [Bdellovibrio sp. HCB2-146]|uniref:hypothetical protein n=1 Tax=Bdellovibrio sp. HCB2-146 TaxID=3394362 RepID=UPI0039BD7D32
MLRIVMTLVLLYLPALAYAGDSCIRIAHNTKTFCQARDICARVGSDSCFSKAYQSLTVEKAADACRGVISDACFNKARETQSLEKAASLCQGVSSDECFKTAFNRYYNLEDSTKVCRDFTVTAPAPVADDPCKTNPH